jgi:hypothetical protein
LRGHWFLQTDGVEKQKWIAYLYSYLKLKKALQIGKRSIAPQARPTLGAFTSNGILIHDLLSYHRKKKPF